MVVLIVDDERSVAETLAGVFRRALGVERCDGVPVGAGHQPRSSRG